MIPQNKEKTRSMRRVWGGGIGWRDVINSSLTSPFSNLASNIYRDITRRFIIRLYGDRLLDPSEKNMCNSLFVSFEFYSGRAF